MGVLSETIYVREQEQYALYSEQVDSIEVMAEMMGYWLTTGRDKVHFLKDQKCPFTLIVEKHHIQITIHDRDYWKKLPSDVDVRYLSIYEGLSIVEKLL